MSGKDSITDHQQSRSPRGRVGDDSPYFNVHAIPADKIELDPEVTMPRSSFDLLWEAMLSKAIHQGEVREANVKFLHKNGAFEHFRHIARAGLWFEDHEILEDDALHATCRASRHLLQKSRYPGVLVRVSVLERGPERFLLRYKPIMDMGLTVIVLRDDSLTSNTLKTQKFAEELHGYKSSFGMFDNMGHCHSYFHEAAAESTDSAVNSSEMVEKISRVVYYLKPEIRHDINELHKVLLAELVEAGSDHDSEGGDRNSSTPESEASENDWWLPKLTILKEIGNAESHEGKVAASTYGSLLGPQPLAGSEHQPDVLADALEMEFSWMTNVISSIRRDLKLRRAAGVPWIKFRPKLLVGPPGTGKTRFAQRLGKLSGTGFSVISAGGSSDNRMLAGTARGWSSGQPCFPVVAMHRLKTANPILVVDEIDKVSRSAHNGNMHATLLGMLESETAKAHFDEFLLTECDISQVSWIMTANDLSTIPEPLLSRVEIIEVGAPGPQDFDALLAGILNDVAEEMMIPVGSLPAINPKAVALLRSAFKKGKIKNVRRLKAAVDAALGVTADMPVEWTLN